VSDFEFVSIILSIVVGLGMTRVLAGLAVVVEYRTRVRVDWPSVGWASGVLAWQIVFWLGTVNTWRSRTEWTFGNLSTLLLMGIALFLAAALVLPQRIDLDTDLAERYEVIRKPFFSLFMAMAVLEVTDSLIPGIRNLMVLGPGYWIWQAIIFSLGLVGASTANRRVHQMLLLIFLGWLLIYAAQVYRI